MRLILAIVGLLLAFIAVVHAQSNEPTECPTISVTGPAGVVMPGETATFTVTVDTKGKEFTLQYNWSISIGTIIQGQGTSTIIVKIADLGSRTATVEISGLPSGCAHTASETLIMEVLLPAIKLDEFVGPLTKIANKRFVKIFEESDRNPNAQLYMILYGTASSIKKKRDALSKLLRPYFRDFQDKRVTLVEAVYRIDRVDVWLVPPGASNPTPDKQ